MGEDGPPRSAGLPPGYDERDPYASEDVSSYPEWWRRNIEEFRAHDLRPYRPPRFRDGDLLPEVVAELESALGVAVQVRTVNPQRDNDAEIVVDGAVAATVERGRTEEGYTLYEIAADEFERLVRDAVER